MAIQKIAMMVNNVGLVVTKAVIFVMLVAVEEVFLEVMKVMVLLINVVKVVW